MSETLDGVMVKLEVNGRGPIETLAPLLLKFSVMPFIKVIDRLKRSGIVPPVPLPDSLLR